MQYRIRLNNTVTQEDEDKIARELLEQYPFLMREFNANKNDDPEFTYAPEAIVDWVIECVILPHRA